MDPPYLKAYLSLFWARRNVLEYLRERKRFPGSRLPKTHWKAMKLLGHRKFSRHISWNVWTHCEGTIWTDPPICAVCSQGSWDAKEVCFGESINVPFSLEILHVSDNFIIQNCIIKCNLGEFMFGNTALDGLMLDKHSVMESTSSQAQLNVCPEWCTAAVHPWNTIKSLDWHLRIIYIVVFYLISFKTWHG